MVYLLQKRTWMETTSQAQRSGSIKWFLIDFSVHELIQTLFSLLVGPCKKCCNLMCHIK